MYGLEANSVTELVYSTSVHAAKNVLMRYFAERRMGTLLEVQADKPVEEIRHRLMLLTWDEGEAWGILPDEKAELLADEGFRIYSAANGIITIASKTAAGVLFGIGFWLRGLSFRRNGHVDMPEGYDIAESPDHEMRSFFIATHRQDNGYKWWTLERHRHYVEDLALWGANLAMYLPMQFGQLSAKSWEQGTPEANDWEAMRNYPNMVHELGLQTGAYIGVNDVFPEDEIGLKHAKNGSSPSMFISGEEAHVCPSNPEAREVLLRRRQELFRLTNLDVVYISPTDYGGCGCDDCDPYPVTYLDLAR
ncbi:MAG: hypothetical protein H7X86_10810, partial [Gorillibacterium sp.]|nr:hypothetical protein [Gorillibacterium sp.]